VRVVRVTHVGLIACNHLLHVPCGRGVALACGVLGIVLLSTFFRRLTTEARLERAEEEEAQQKALRQASFRRLSALRMPSARASASMCAATAASSTTGDAATTVQCDHSSLSSVGSSRALPTELEPLTPSLDVLDIEASIALADVDAVSAASEPRKSIRHPPRGTGST
jgi:hypothetical protein